MSRLLYQTALVLAWSKGVIGKRSWFWQGDGIRRVVSIPRLEARDLHHCMSLHQLRSEGESINGEGVHRVLAATSLTWRIERGVGTSMSLLRRS